MQQSPPPKAENLAAFMRRFLPNEAKEPRESLYRKRKKKKA
jgi:hypothetical protein